MTSKTFIPMINIVPAQVGKNARKLAGLSHRAVPFLVTARYPFSRLCCHQLMLVLLYNKFRSLNALRNE